MRCYIFRVVLVDSCVQIEVSIGQMDAIKTLRPAIVLYTIYVCGMSTIVHTLVLSYIPHTYMRVE